MVATTRSASRSKSIATSPTQPLSPSVKKVAKTFNHVTFAKPVERNWPIRWFVYGALFLALEFALKYLAYQYPPSMRLFTMGEFVHVQLCSVVNPDSALSMMRSVPVWGKQALMAVSILLLAYVTYLQITSPEATTLTRRGVLCLIVGAIGNGPDRLLVGGVVDYIYFQTGAWGGHYSLAWNISDLLINLGLAHVLLSAFREERKVKDKAQ